MLGGLSAALRRVEEALMAVAAVSLMLMMLIVVADVVMRYVFNSPLPWVFDFISNYIVVAAFFLAISATLREGGHLSIDLLRFAGPGWWRCLQEIVVWAIVLVLCVMLVRLSGAKAWVAWRDDAVMTGPIAWPTWASWAISALGLGITTLRVAERLAERVSDLVHGRAPPIPSHAGLEDEL